MCQKLKILPAIHLTESVSKFLPTTICISLWLLLTLRLCGGSNEMDSEYNRLSSYQAWPHYDHALPTRLARAGFSYTQQADQVQCFSCGVTLSGWRNRGPPWQEHVTESPNCPFVTGRDRRNIPLCVTQEGETACTELRRTGRVVYPDELDRDTSGSQTNTGAPLEHQNVEQNQQTNENLPPSHHTRHTVNHEITPPHADRGQTRVGQIVSTLPSIPRARHPEYSSLSNRLDTFIVWPTGRQQTPQIMAQAGFFYAGTADSVRCFFCHGGLQNWLPGDNPWVEHARWFPRCTFVARTQGTGFIQAVANGQTVVPVTPQSENVPVDIATSGETASPAGRHTGAGDTIAANEAPLTNVPRNTSVSPGSPPVTDNSKSDESDSSNGHRDGGSDDNTSNRSSAISATSLVAAVAAVARSKPKRKKRRKGKPVRERPSSEACNDIQARLSALMRDKQEMEEKNRELREAERCKVCMDEDISIVFLPCGHRVTCPSCAANLRNCPMCRTLIRGTIKSYLV